MLMPNFDAWNEVFKFAGALSVVTSGMAWWRKDSLQEDEMIVESSNIVIDAVTNADMVSKIDAQTGKNLRDQLTVKQLEEMNDERKLRSFKNRN